MIRPLWAVVLAGGAGRRLAAVTNGVPKQYWCPDGRQPTLLEETLRRLGPLTEPARTTLVIDRLHEPYLRARPVDPALTVLSQPIDRGTAPGVLFGLSRVLAEAPQDTLIVSPSDHGVRRAWRFRNSVLSVAALVESGRQGVVLFGVAPADPCPEYGWIQRGRPCAGTPLHHVDGFVEKPSPELARELYEGGAVWNTMVLVARAAALAALFERWTPGLAALFADYRTWPESQRLRRLAARYAALAPVDFSRDVIARAPDLTVCTWPASIGWADLGTPERLRQWMGHPPARPAAEPPAPGLPVPGSAA